jgi:hypothetical protein
MAGLRAAALSNGCRGRRSISSAEIESLSSISLAEGEGDGDGEFEFAV